MESLDTRKDRKNVDLRPLKIETHVNRYAEGSALIHMGHTQVLCTASIEESVPKWLEKQHPGQGWVTAEYSMLPRSTHTRNKRDREKMTGRTHEIQRLIGRALRSVIDLKALGPRSITLDCDVIQADGGTRTAAINGAYVALSLALKNRAPLAITDQIGAVSVGFVTGASGLAELRVDLNYEEDSTSLVDLNLAMLSSGQFIEIQGTAEHGAFSREQLNQMLDGASNAVRQIHVIQKRVLGA